MKSKFQNKVIYWYTDSSANSLIVNKGSSKEKLQELALNIFKLRRPL